MNQEELLLQDLVNRWEDRREIQNNMGKFTYALLLKEERDVLDRFWSSKQDICLGDNQGFYAGRDAVKAYYDALHEKNLLRTKLILEDFKDKAAGLNEEEMYGCGVLEHKPLSNQIIEIAEDRQSAKAFWYVVGKVDEYGAYGPLSYWTFGMYGVDFVREDEEWKIWHLDYVEDIHTPCGESWAAEPKKREENPAYTQIASFEMPQPNISREERQLYHPERAFTKTLPLPVAYKTFEETFSYGAEGGAS